MFYRILVIIMEIHSSYFSYLFALGIGQSVMLTTALLKSGQKKSLSRIFFLSVLVIMGVEILYGLLYQTSSIYDFPHLLRINTFLVMAFGPSLYLALLFYFKPDKVFSKPMLLHFLPSLLTFIYFIPLFFSTVSAKTAYLDIMYTSIHRDSFVFGGFRRLQQGVYLMLALQLIWQNRTELKSRLKSHYFRPLFALFLLFAFMWLGDVYRYFFQFHLYSGIVNTVLMSSLLLYLTIKLVSRESFFKETEHEKYASTGLSPAREVEIISEIKTLFSNQKLHTDPSLSLSELASRLKLPHTHISQAINRQEHMNYSDFINLWRVEEAKSLLKDPQNHKLTLLYIAQQSGFKSSSAFNAAFRKVADTTPSQFRRQFA